MRSEFDCAYDDATVVRGRAEAAVRRAEAEYRRAMEVFAAREEAAPEGIVFYGGRPRALGAAD